MATFGLNPNPSMNAIAKANDLQAGANGPGLILIDPSQTRASRPYVYIFNIARRTFEVNNPIKGKLFCAACPADQRYIHVATLNEHEPENVYHPDTGNGIRYELGQRIAMDIVNPDNPTLDQNATGNGYSSGNNYSARGLFWSLTNPPSEIDLKNAQARLERFYDELIRRADVLELSNEKELGEMLQTTPDLRYALDYRGEERKYHKKRGKVEHCPNCGMQIASGVAWHKDADGDLCVIDWVRAVISGKVSREAVPDAIAAKVFPRDGAKKPQ